MRGVLLCVLVVAACDGGDDGEGVPGVDAGSGTGADAGPACVARARGCAEIEAAFVATGTDVDVSCDEAAGQFTVSASGLPNYVSNQSTPNQIGVQGWVLTLPLTPTCVASPEDVVASRGPIGLMVNGVPFFGPQNIAGQDAPTVEAATLDTCSGHADMMCVYHYHSLAQCVFGPGVGAGDFVGEDGHAPLIGFAVDGFGVYAGEDNGSGAWAPLDACNGHVDAARGYHYHATATSPYFVGCLRGERWTLSALDQGCD